MDKRKFEPALIFLLALLLMGGIYATTVSNAQTSLSGFISSLTGSSPSSGSGSVCSMGQDFAVQISALGCEPTVVRSDLLEQQDVQVYCPLMATQLNPSVNVQSIGSISFRGSYPSTIRSIGFYPAQAALSANNQLTNSPVINNIGYVVIDLKQQPNESAMPDSVNGSLVASLKYNANNALGIGTVQYTIPQLTDSDWQAQYPEYSFWGGKGYVKVDNIQGSQATISVYDKNLNRISSATLQSGQTSGDMSIPGFNPCSATMNVKLDGVQNADTMAKLEINGNIVDVAKGGSFINSMCQIKNIEKDGLVQDVQVTCNTDSGYKTFDLAISPRVTIDINGTKKDYGIGDYLFTVPNGDFIDKGKSVYLGYIGYNSLSNLVSSDKNNVKNIYLYLAVLAKTPAQFEEKMTSSELSSFSTLAQLVTPSQMAKNPILSVGLNAFKGIAAIFDGITQFTVGGTDLIFLQYGIPQPNLAAKGLKVNFTGFASSADYPLNSPIKTIYNEAAGDYNTVQQSYSGETYPSANTATLGEEALYRQINLTYNLGQKTSVQSLCKEFKKDYPNSNYDISKFCDNGAVLSSRGENSQYVTIGGQAYQITLDGIKEPSLNDFSAVVNVKFPDGRTEPITLSKDQVWTLNVSQNEYIQLSSLGDGTATLNIPAGIFGSGSMTLQQGVPATLGHATGILKSKNVYTLTLTKVNLKKYAKVEIEPKINDKGSQANFSFNIGIEKRSIKLNPAQTKSLINNLDGTISTLNKISTFTGKAVNVSTKLCQAAGLTLTVLNFINNLGGTGLARTQVMTGAGGWDERCTQMVNAGKYSTVDQCLLDNSKQIDSDVNQTAFIMSQQNKQVGDIQSKYTTKPSGLASVLSSSVLDTNKFMQDYSTDVQSSLGCLGTSISNPSSSNAKAISVSDAKTLLSYDSYSKNNYNTQQAKDVQLYSQILCSSSSSASLKATAQQQLYNTLSNIQTNAGNYAAVNKLASNAGVKNPSQVGQILELDNNVKKYPYLGLTVAGLSSAAAAKLEGTKDLNGNTITATTAAYISPASDGNNYILILGNPYQTSILPVTGVYDISGNPVKDTSVTGKILGKIEFQKADASSYQNPYKANQGSTVPEVQYFETNPYKGLPAIVPFDLKNGWYAAVKQTTSAALGSSTSSYDNSGRVESFFLCNVGANGIEEFNSQTGDDTCQSINLGTGTTYNQFGGITDSGQVTKLVSQAQQAITSAASQYKSGVSSVVINGQSIKVGSPAVNLPAIQCQDFMSPSDCNKLFNACDPVVCPPSRCDFGGAYHVQDVVQSGIVGSVLLCFPNAREGILVPVCLTGIQAGLENWISVLNSTKDCLQNQLKTGQTTGICNEVESVYTCNLIWSEVAPLAGIVVPKLASSVLGQSAQGGGEYSNFQNALNTAKQSESYITNLYASSLPKAFATGNVTIGKAICKNFVSTVFPDEANLVNQLGTTDSPPQYTGSFNSIAYTTSTVPPQSQYQVYYHIYAGKNSGVYYSVYLEGSGSSYYQDTSSPRTVDSGYIAAGGSEDQTKDFTAPTGYTKLCISVNGNEDCGFKQVSSSLAANYVQDYYVASQVNNTNIKTSAECTSGTISLASILSSSGFNAQNAINNAVHPSISSLGITRVCATKNPGLGTDPNANSQNSRWVQTGTCSDINMGCWLDTQSVKEAINSPDISAYLANGTTTTLQNSTLQSVNSAYQSLLLNSGQFLTDSQFDSNVSAIAKESDPNKVINEVNALMNKVFYNNQKGELYLLRGGAYARLALAAQSRAVSGTSQTNCFSNYEECVNSLGSTSQVCSTCYPNCFSSYSQCVNSLGTGSKVCDACYPVSSGSGNSKGTGATTAPAAASPGGTSGSASPGSIAPSKISANDIFNAMSSSSVNCQCGTREQCQSYADSLSAASAKYNEDPLLLLAIMIQESNCKLDAKGGNSVGLMQVDPTSVSDCVSAGIGVSGIADVTGAANTGKNILCGSYILKEKNSAYGGGQSYTFPAQGTAQCSDGFTAAYSGWDAAIRGYNGWGCPAGTNEHYVEQVDSIWNKLVNAVNPSLLVPPSAGAAVTCGFSSYDACVASLGAGSQVCNMCSQSTAASAGPASSGDISSDLQVQNTYAGLKSLFDKYSQGSYVPNGWSSKDFKALLVAIADQNGFGGSGGTWVMGYGTGDNSVQSAEVQISQASSALKTALEGNGAGEYSQCKPSVADESANLKCVLSVYKTGKLPAPLVAISFLMGDSSVEGRDYANSVIGLWKKWINYFDLNGQGSATESYNNFKSLFEQYSQLNLPVGWKQNDFKALLVAVAADASKGFSSSDWIMGYHATDSSVKSSDDQIKIVSAILKSAINGNSGTLGWQSGSTDSYGSCNSGDVNSKVKCILSVYHSGQTPAPLVNIPFITGISSTAGRDYANKIFDDWNNWKSYFNSQKPTSGSSAATVSSTEQTSSSSQQVAETKSGIFWAPSSSSENGPVSV